MEVRRELDATDPASERSREYERGAAASRRDVENTRLQPEAEAFAEQEQFLLRRRVLQLVRRLGDDVVARDHGPIIYAGAPDGEPRDRRGQLGDRSGPAAPPDPERPRNGTALGESRRVA